MATRRQRSRTDCFHGSIGRRNAEEELQKVIYEVGTFLIRSSTDRPNYALSIKNPQKSIAHYLIVWHGSIYNPYFSIEGGPLFRTINQLIQYYTSYSEGLPCILGESVIKDPLPRLSQPPNDPVSIADKVHVAAYAGDLTTMQQLVSFNVSCVHVKNTIQCTPLHVATLEGHENVVKELLQANANVNAPDSRGYTPLQYAATIGHTTICQILLNHGANLAQRSATTGRYAIHEAAMRGYSNCLQMLVDRGSPLLATSYDDKTPLQIASLWKRQECCTILSRKLINENGRMEGDWLHMNISEADAEKLLYDYSTSDGRFLILQTADSLNPYSMFLYEQNKVIRYTITFKNDVYFIKNGPGFKYLSNMVDYYMKWKDDSLPLKLKEPLTNNIRPAEQAALLINFNKIERKKIIGSGQYGNVYLAVWERDDGTKLNVAVKTFSTILGKSVSDDILKEANMMLNLNHANIVRLLGISIDPLVLVQELMSMGSLIDYLKDCKNDNINIPLEDKLSWAKQIATGMSYVESKGIFHGDLAARNILMASKNVVKITDFGLSRRIDRTIDGVVTIDADANQYLPIRWYAFESIFHNKFSSKSDVWSYGITLWEIFTNGLQPYYNFRVTKEIMDFLNSNRRLEIPRDCPPIMSDIMKKCWLKNLDDRPTFAQIQYSIDEFMHHHQL